MTAQTEIGTLAVKVGEISGQLRELKVLPNSPVSNVVRMGGRYAELTPKLSASESGRSNLQDLLVRQSRSLRRLAFGLAPAPLARRVCGVSGLCSPKEMSGVAARRIVAAMQRAVSFVGALSSGKCKAYVRGLNVPLCGQAEVSVSARPPVSQPRSALFRAASVNLIPEAGLRTFRNIVYGEYSHGALLSHGGQGRSALARCFGPFFLAESPFVRNCGGAL